MDTVKDELDRIMSEDELRDSVLLVIANKQDLSGAKSPMALGELLELHKKQQRCRTYVFSLI